ncbi:hypothetical protein HY384_02760 [Candidatus Daviesbacteria bacterium]|nr:hypothetical protein [Candidatus Daviesbacteria bacterium]
MSNQFFEQEPLPNNLINFPRKTIEPELTVRAGSGSWQQEIEGLINRAIKEKTVKTGPLWMYYVTLVAPGATFETGWTQMDQLVDPRLGKRKRFGETDADRLTRLSSAQDRFLILRGLGFGMNEELMGVEGEWKREESKDGNNIHYFLPSEGRREVYLVRTMVPRFMSERLMFCPDQTFLEQYLRIGLL